MLRRPLLFLISLMLLLPLSVEAQNHNGQSRRERLIKMAEDARARLDSMRDASYEKLKENKAYNHMDSVLTAREERAHSKYDTNYISTPEGRWTFKLRGNVSGAQLRTRVRSDGAVRQTKLDADRKGTITFSIGYRGLTFALAANPAKWVGKYKDFEFNLNSYSSRYGFDIVYSTANTYAGDVKLDGDKVGEVSNGEVGMHSYVIDAYYAFNYRRFSFPAAFSQSQIQRRSAGSWLLGLSVLGGRATQRGDYRKLFGSGSENETTLTDDGDNTQQWKAHTNMMNVGLGGGYGYNLVAKHNWLFHLSMMPHVVVVSHARMHSQDGERSTHWRFPNFITVVRAAVVHNFNSYFFNSQFLGVSYVYHNSLTGNLGSMEMLWSKWRIRAFWGFRL